jgi:hypothetical protein
MFDDVMTIVIGNSRAISTSKFKKITSIRKNRSENGSRADLLGSNPHSNGDLFSRSSLFSDRNDVSIMIIVVSVSVIIVAVSIFNTTCLIQTS